MNKRIVHIDLNCFFAQCEVLKDPSLKGKPIAVGYDGKRSVVATASYEARKFGVNSAMPISEAKRKCHSLIIVNSDFRYYEQKSHEFFSFLKARYPILEKASIDECYIDMTGYYDIKEEHAYLFDLQMLLYKVTGLKCSIGAGETRFLAKMGSDMKKPLGLTIINREDIPSLLWPLKIGKMFGIGKRTEPKLIELGINTIGDLANNEDPRVADILGSMYEMQKGHACGLGSDVVDPNPWDPKSCSAERTFPDDAQDEDELSAMIYSCCQDMVSELNHYQKEALTLVVKIRDSEFITRSKRSQLSHPSDKLDEIYSAARNLFFSFYKDYPVRLIGVGAEKVQNKEKKKDDETKRLVDKFNSELSEKGNLYLIKDE